MHDVLGIVTFSSNAVDIRGLGAYRSDGAISFFGRYRLIDFVLSNFTNSGIEDIQIYVKKNPRSLVEHVRRGNYNINSKRGSLKFLFASSYRNHGLYNNDITCYMENIEQIMQSDKEYVILAPSYLVNKINYNDVLKEHIEKENDITVVYTPCSNAKEDYMLATTLVLDKQSRVTKIEPNLGKYKARNISTGTLVMKRELFISLINKAANTSSLFTFADIIKDSIDDIKVCGYKFKGSVFRIASFEEYYKSNMQLRNRAATEEFMDPHWPIHTKTNDSSPTIYTEDAEVSGSVIANGCIIEGTVINSVIGRNVTIAKGAVVKDSVILPSVKISKNSHIECAVIDKYAEVKYVNEIKGTKKHPIYVKRRDRI